MTSSPRFGSTRSGKVYITIALTLLVTSSYGFYRHARAQGGLPVWTSGSDVQDPNAVGNIGQAMQQAQQLMTALQNANGDPTQVVVSNPSLLVLPDHQYAENTFERGDNVASFIFPDDQLPEQSQLVFYCDIYARQNTAIYTESSGQSSPSGYFILGWKDGTVQQVSVASARYVTRADGTRVVVFPGMNGYNATAPVWGN